MIQKKLQMVRSFCAHKCQPIKFLFVSYQTWGLPALCLVMLDKHTLKQDEPGEVGNNTYCSFSPTQRTSVRSVELCIEWEGFWQNTELIKKRLPSQTSLNNGVER